MSKHFVKINEKGGDKKPTYNFNHWPHPHFITHALAMYNFVVLYNVCKKCDTMLLFTSVHLTQIKAGTKTYSSGIITWLCTYFNEDFLQEQK